MTLEVYLIISSEPWLQVLLCNGVAMGGGLGNRDFNINLTQACCCGGSLRGLMGHPPNCQWKVSHKAWLCSIIAPPWQSFENSYKTRRGRVITVEVVRCTVVVATALKAVKPCDGGNNQSSGPIFISVIIQFRLTIRRTLFSLVRRGCWYKLSSSLALSCHNVAWLLFSFPILMFNHVVYRCSVGSVDSAT